MKKHYNNNSDFKGYVDRYAKKHGITVEEALTHEIVKTYYLCKREEANNDKS